MGNIMKKVLFFFVMIMMLGIMTACGNEGTKEHIKTGEERAIELKDKAEDAVDKVNKDTIRLSEESILDELK